MSSTPPPPPPPPPGSPGAPGPPDPGAASPPPPAPGPSSPPDPEPWAPVGDQPLARPVVLLWRVGAAIPMGVLLLVSLGAAIGLGGPAWAIPAAAVALAVLVVGLLPRWRYRRWRWRMTPRALELSHGVVFRQVRALPYFRIQHIDVEHGPLDRGLGLARLEVHTASVTATLPGLAADDAPRVRAALLQRASDAVASTDRDDDAV